MAPRFTGTLCGRVLFVGLVVTGGVYALVALRQVTKVDLALLRSLPGSRGRLDGASSHGSGSGSSSSGAGGRASDNSSSADAARLRETIRALEARLEAAEASRRDRETAAGGGPRGRRIYTDLTAYPFREDPHYRESTCPKTVASISQYSTWFKERYRPRVKVFLDSDDVGNLSDISHHGLPFGYRGESKELLAKILTHPSFANAPIHSAGTSKQCTRCAVVGCGGILKESGAGQEIDSHDYVFRLNHAVSAGRLEKDVGRKTSFYIFFPESMSIRSLVDKDAKYIYTMFKAYDMNYALNMLNKEKPPEFLSRGQILTLQTPNVDPAKLKIVHPDFFRYTFAGYLDAVAYRPTTGAMVVFLALHLCDEVTIYGYGYDPRFTMHYYDTHFVKHTDVSTGSHDVDNERHLWQKLHDEGVIRLFKRDT